MMECLFVFAQALQTSKTFILVLEKTTEMFRLLRPELTTLFIILKDFASLE